MPGIGDALAIDHRGGLRAGDRRAPSATLRMQLPWTSASPGNGARPVASKS